MPLKKKSALSFILVGFAMLTSACGMLRGRNDLTLGSDIQLINEATLTCSQECAARSQCGQGEQGQMVLLHSQQPVTSGHDMAVPDGTQVTIDHQEMRAAIQASDQQPMQVPFYLVRVPERGLGWTPGWCVGQ